MTIKLNNHILDTFMEKAYFYYDLPGIAVSVGNGNQSYSKVFGYQNALIKKLLFKRHIFHMASLSKLFVGTSILQLWEKGIVDIDEKLISYLPWFEMADSRCQGITLRQLLSHTSGMPDITDYHWEDPETDDFALQRFVQSDEVTCARLLWAPEDGRFSYSNMGYEVLGVVIATMSGLTFENYVDKNIFKVLGMDNSTFLTFERDMAEVCSPHIKTPQKETIIAPHFPYNRAHAPSSTLTSNLADLEKWALANLSQTILRRDTYDSAWTKQAPVPNNGEHICLSWFCREQQGHILYGHEGNDDGFRSSFWISPELDLFIIVCSNLSGAPVKKISKQLFDLLVG